MTKRLLDPNPDVADIEAGAREQIQALKNVIQKQNDKMHELEIKIAREDKNRELLEKSHAASISEMKSYQDRNK